MASKKRSTIRKPKSTRPRSPRPSEGEGRDRILETAIRAFAERGFAGTSTADVAREAGVTQPLVHHHFGSKEGLWRASVDRLFDGVPALASAVDEDSSPAEQLLAMTEGFVHLSAARPAIARFMAREGATAGPRLDYLLSKWVGATFDHVVATVKKAQRAGEVARELRPELLLFFFLGAGGHLFDVSALAIRAFGLDPSLPEVQREYVALFRLILRGGVLLERKRR